MKQFLVYNKEKMDFTFARKMADRWYKLKLIDDQTLTSIYKTCSPELQQFPFFGRLGAFLFGCFLVGASTLFFFPFVDGFSNEDAVGGLVIFLSLVYLFLLEYIIKQREYYKAGIDDALLYAASSYFVGGLIIFQTNEFLIYVVIIMISLAAAIRYTDSIAVAVFYATITILCFRIFDALSLEILFVPFVMMGLTALFYFMTHKFLQHESSRYWFGTLQVSRLCAILLFYLSGNYYVIDTIGNEMLGEGFISSLGFVAYYFWVHTVLLPVLLVVYAIKNKDRVLMRAALLLFAAGVITFKIYFSLGKPEITLTLAGAGLILFSIGVIRLLQKPKFGICYNEEEPDESWMFGPEMQNFVTHIMTQQDNTPTNENVKTGGGSFGGGGADASY